MHTPFLELTVITLAVLRVAVPVFVLLTVGMILGRRERRSSGKTG